MMSAVFHNNKTWGGLNPGFVIPKIKEEKSLYGSSASEAFEPNSKRAEYQGIFNWATLLLSLCYWHLSAD